MLSPCPGIKAFLQKWDAPRQMLPPSPTSLAVSEAFPVIINRKAFAEMIFSSLQVTKISYRNLLDKHLWALHPQRKMKIFPPLPPSLPLSLSLDLPNWAVR
jgi:hypothetical protein